MADSSLGKWYASIKSERGEDIILGVLGNKADLENREVGTEEGLKKAEEWKALFQECSAKTGENVTSFFKLILDMLIKSSEEDIGGVDAEKSGKVIRDLGSKKSGKDRKGGCC